jgi:hypothetical protein
MRTSCGSIVIPAQRTSIYFLWLSSDGIGVVGRELDSTEENGAELRLSIEEPATGAETTGTARLSPVSTMEVAFLENRYGLV